MKKEMSKEKSDKIQKHGLVLQKFQEEPKLKRKRGRPPKTIESLPHDWKKIVLDLMEEGASIEEIKAEFRIWDATYRRMYQNYPEFAAVIEQGKLLSKAWWMRTGRTQLFNKDFSATLWYMNMKNRFGWTDKQEQTHVMDIPVRITIQKADRVIELKPPSKQLAPGSDDGE